LPTDSTGIHLIKSRLKQELHVKLLGKFIYPIFREDGSLLPTSATTNRHVNDDGLVIPTNDYGQPLDRQGNL
jgi:hypothetical protein